MNDWRTIAVKPSDTMQKVMQVIDTGRMQIALVVDDNDHLIGTVTDGDIRRAILKGRGLDTPVQEYMNKNPTTGLIDEEPSSWQRTMLRHTLRHLPLLDAGGCIAKLTFLEPPREPVRDNPVVLMAGGLGTRLRPLTEKKPKPLLTIGNKPILETIIENFVSQGFHKFYVCINYKGDMIREHFKDGSQWDASITYIEENKRLGTAGALSLIKDKIDLPFFVMNGDLLTKVDFVRLSEFHKQQQNTITMCVREYRYQIPYGVVSLDRHRITGISEKPIQYYQVNAGIYMLDHEIINDIPHNQFYDMTTLIEVILAKNITVGSFPLREYWMDVGRVEDFEQAHSEYFDQFEQ
ncbi:MAG: nucleotidyltransferase family protein [Gammaproteobacteria bacterium]|nr:nucleotidyltransferase family protein [Gammaproteobacteria bacterium]